MVSGVWVEGFEGLGVKSLKVLSGKQAVGADMLQIGPGVWVLSAAFASEFHRADWGAVKVAGVCRAHIVVGLLLVWWVSGVKRGYIITQHAGCLLNGGISQQKNY